MDEPGATVGRGARSAGNGVGRQLHDAEVVAISQRRRLTAAYKRRVLAEAEACPAPGQVGPCDAGKAGIPRL